MTQELSKDLFDRKWRQSCQVLPAPIKDVDQFIQAHYLQKRPAIVLLSLMALLNEKPIGCAVYSAPPKETSKRYGGETWELARVYLTDEIPKNAETWLIGSSIRFIKKFHPQVACLVSYADPSVGHTGTIYRAGNWVSDGRTDDGRKTPRCDYVDSRTGKKYGRKGNLPPDAIVARVPRVSKYRFYYRLKEILL